MEIGSQFNTEIVNNKNMIGIKIHARRRVTRMFDLGKFYQSSRAVVLNIIERAAH
jgi:hypothetical protein